MQSRHDISSFGDLRSFSTEQRLSGTALDLCTAPEGTTRIVMCMQQVL